MRVLLVNKFHYLRGGSERYYFTLASLLEKAGHEVFYFAINDDKNIETKDKKYFLNNVGAEGGIIGKVRMIKNMNYSKEAYKKIKEEIKEVKPDLAILNLVHKQISLSIVDALKENKNPIFWVVHDLIFVCPSYTMLDGNGNIVYELGSDEIIEFDGNVSYIAPFEDYETRYDLLISYGNFA